MNGLSVVVESDWAVLSGTERNAMTGLDPADICKKTLRIRAEQLDTLVQVYTLTDTNPTLHPVLSFLTVVLSVMVC